MLACKAADTRKSRVSLRRMGMAEAASGYCALDRGWPRA